MPTHCSHSPKQTVVVIGSGFSGTMTAVNILRQNQAGDIRVVLVEQHATFGRGLAYSTWDDNFLLNVPAGNMSALADEPDDFVNFCSNIDPAFTAASFIPRRIYGDYIAAALSKIEKEFPHLLGRIHGEAVAVRRMDGDSGFVVQLADGQLLAAKKIVLAFGHFPPKQLQTSLSPSATTAVVESPWDFDRLDRLDPHRPVLLLGSGHTAIDVLFRLTKSSNSRKIILLSRRGLLPKEHRFKPKPPAPKAFPAYLRTPKSGLRTYLRALRDEAKHREENGGDWRDVLNELRPYVPEIWGNLSLPDRRKFFVHAMAYWDIHRHRLAPSAYCRLEQMRESGQVEILAGKLVTLHNYGQMNEVEIRQRGSGKIRQLTVAGVVNCIGPNYDIATITVPLVAQLRDEALLKQDEMKIGFDVDDHYQVIDRRGHPVPGLFYIGPMLKARYWEAIAVPELRVHSQNLAKYIVARTMVDG